MDNISKEEILDKHDGYGLPTIVNRSKALAAMDEYAKQQSIAFALSIVGQLKVNPENKTSYEKGSNEDILINLPATIEQRYKLFIQSQQ